MKYQFKITGKQEYQSGIDETTTNFTLTPVPGQVVNGNINIQTKDQAEANNLNFGEIVNITIEK